MASIISASTTSATALNLSGDTTGILQLATGATPTTAVTIDASQNVGIGTSTPAGYKLNVQGGDVNLTGSFYARSQNYFGAANANFTMQHYTNANWNYSNLNLWRNATNTSTPRFLGMPLDGDSNANATIGGFNAIWGAYDSTPTTGSTSSGLNGKIVYGAYAGHQWYTNGTERMRIDSSGNLLVGYTSSNGAYKLQVNSQIFATSATIATSDGRYKKDIQSLDGALGLVNQLNPVQFSWKQHPVHAFDTSTPTIGFIAQEVQQVLADKPYLSSIIKSNKCVIKPEEKDDDGNMTKEAVTEEFLGIAEGNMIALLTKAIQELKAIIDTQQTRITALEAK